MNKLAPSLAAALLVTSSAVLAQSLGEKTGVNSALGISPTTQDFMTEAANSDLLEIAAAQIALQKGNDDEKKFAERMVIDHTGTSKELKAMVTGGGVKAEVPTILETSYQKKLDKLREAKPADFAGEYTTMQISAHKDTVSLFERYSKSGDDPKLKDWASKTLPTMRHHLKMAEALKNSKATIGTSR